MFLRVLNSDNEYAGCLNLDNVDLIKLIESATTQPNTLEVWKGTTKQVFKISKSAYLGLDRYLDRNGIV